MIEPEGFCSICGALTYLLQNLSEPGDWRCWSHRSSTYTRTERGIEELEALYARLRASKCSMCPETYLLVSDGEKLYCEAHRPAEWFRDDDSSEQWAMEEAVSRHFKGTGLRIPEDRVPKGVNWRDRPWGRINAPQDKGPETWRKVREFQRSIETVAVDI